MGHYASEMGYELPDSFREKKLTKVSVPDLRMLLIDIVDDIVDGINDEYIYPSDLKRSLHQKINRAILEGDL